MFRFARRVRCFLRGDHRTPRLFATDPKKGEELWVCVYCLALWHEYIPKGKSNEERSGSCATGSRT